MTTWARVAAVLVAEGRCKLKTWCGRGATRPAFTLVLLEGGSVCRARPDDKTTLVDLDQVLANLRSRLEPHGWTVEDMLHQPERPPCELVQEIARTDVLVTAHGFQVHAPADGLFELCVLSSFRSLRFASEDHVTLCGAGRNVPETTHGVRSALVRMHQEGLGFGLIMRGRWRRPFSLGWWKAEGYLGENTTRPRR